MFKKLTLFLCVIFSLLMFIKLDNVYAAFSGSNQQTVIAYSHLYDLQGGSGNNKSRLRYLFLDEDDHIWVVWEADINGFKDISNLTINNETYNPSEITPGTLNLIIKDTENNTLQNLNANYYYFAQELHPTQRLNEVFTLTISAGSAGHSMTGVAINVLLNDNHLAVKQNYWSNESTGEESLDLVQSLNNFTPGDQVTLHAIPKDGYSYINAEIVYNDGTRETTTDDEFTITLVEGKNEVIFNYGIGYRVEYYYDDVIDPDLNEFNYGSFGDVITLTDFNTNLKFGYQFDRVEPSSLTLSDTLIYPCIRVYYSTIPNLKSNIVFVHHIDGDAMDPTYKYTYVLRYTSNGNTLEQQYELSDGESFNTEIDFGSSYEIVLTDSVNDDDITYDGLSNYANKVISGIASSDTVNEELKIGKSFSPLTGLAVELKAFILMFILCILAFGYIIYSKKNNK